MVATKMNIERAEIKERSFAVIINNQAVILMPKKRLSTNYVSAGRWSLNIYPNTPKIKTNTRTKEHCYECPTVF